MSQYHQQYYAQQHQSSVAPNTSYKNSYATYSSPIGDPYKVQQGLTSSYMATGMPENSSATTRKNRIFACLVRLLVNSIQFFLGVSTATTTAQVGNQYHYGSVYGYNPENCASTMSTRSYSYPTSSSQVINNAAPPINVAASKESNIDLLTGIYFENYECLNYFHYY